MPNSLVLIEETTVRESGESAVITLPAPAASAVLKLVIDHVRQQQDLDVEILASEDGDQWEGKPIAAFLRKMHCGVYTASLPCNSARYMKAVWRLNTWGRSENRPLVSFSLVLQQPALRAMASGA